MSSDKKNYGENKAFNKRVTGKEVAHEVKRKSRRSSDPTVNYIEDLQRTVGNKGVEQLIKSGTIQPDQINRQINNTQAQEAKSALASLIAAKNYSVFRELDSKGLFGGVQTKMTVGGANDVYEQEADRVADTVVNMSDADIQQKSNDLKIQAKGSSRGSFTVNSNVESGIRSMKGGGQSLSGSEGEFYKSRFNRDFSDVRIHTGDKADKLARDINARAFTTGNDIFFANGEYSPGTRTGKMLMAHELTHVVQQGKGIKRKKKTPIKSSPKQYKYQLKNGKIYALVTREKATLWGISKDIFGNGKYYTELATYNNIKKPDLIKKGYEIYIPLSPKLDDNAIKYFYKRIKYLYSNLTKVKKRAKAIFNAAESVFSTDSNLINLLKELNKGEIEELKKYYKRYYSPKRKGRDLITDVIYELENWEDQYKALKSLNHNIIEQNNLLPNEAKKKGITSIPMLTEVSPGIKIEYILNKGNFHSDPNAHEYQWFDKKDGALTKLDGKSSYSVIWKSYGVHTLICGVRHKKDNPVFYEYRQIVSKGDPKIRRMSHNGKMAKAIDLAKSKLVKKVLDEIGGIGVLISSMLIMGGIMIAIASTGIGILADIAILTGLAISISTTIKVLVDAIKCFAEFYSITKVAGSEHALKYAGELFHEGVAKIGVVGLMALLSMFGMKSRKNTKNRAKLKKELQRGKRKQGPKRGSVNELLVNGAVPSRTRGEFHRWFDKLTPDEFDRLWANQTIQKTIRERLLFKGGHHEWLPRSRANVFKRWGLSVKDIANSRVLKERVHFKNPSGSHSGNGSTAWHNELINLVDSADSFAHYKTLVQKFARRRLSGGVKALPKLLRP